MPKRYTWQQRGEYLATRIGLSPESFASSIDRAMATQATIAGAPAAARTRAAGAGGSTSTGTRTRKRTKATAGAGV